MQTKYRPIDVKRRSLVPKITMERGYMVKRCRVPSTQFVKNEMKRYNIPTDGTATPIDIFEYKKKKKEERETYLAQKEERRKARKNAFYATKKEIAQKGLLLDPITGDPYYDMEAITERINTFVPKQYRKKVPIKLIELMNSLASDAHKKIFGTHPEEIDLSTK